MVDTSQEISSSYTIIKNRVAYFSKDGRAVKMTLALGVLSRHSLKKMLKKSKTALWPIENKNVADSGRAAD